MKIKVDKKGLLFVPEDAKDGFEIGRIHGMFEEFSDSLRWLIYDKECGINLRICQEPLEIEKRSMKLVDELLQWEGTGRGRLDRIEELLEIERNSDVRGD